jgi:outer membrane protein OmpA-like peptidoglycan-associated protein
VEIIETKAMDRNMVTIDAAAMEKGLNAEGKIALYGILFDTDKADIKPESKPQLEEMAKLLRSKLSLKVYIVGHTDNQGALDHNIGLSQRRAEAVVKALSSDYGIDPRRLMPKGLANFAPIASNQTEEGRAKNRRVELVEQ